MLSWRWYTAATGGIRTHDLAVASPAPYHTSTAFIATRGIKYEIEDCKTHNRNATSRQCSVRVRVCEDNLEKGIVQHVVNI